jgi:hypothetical protein
LDNIILVPARDAAERVLFAARQLSSRMVASKDFTSHHHYATPGMIDEENLAMLATSVYLTLSTLKCYVI